MTKGNQIITIEWFVRIPTLCWRLLCQIELVAFKSLLVGIKQFSRDLALLRRLFHLAGFLLCLPIALLLGNLLPLESRLKLLLLLLLVVHQVELGVRQHFIEICEALICHSAHLSVCLVSQLLDVTASCRRHEVSRWL